MGYPVDWVQYEVAFLGRHVHWTLRELLELDHAERRRWVAQAADLIEDEQPQ